MLNGEQVDRITTPSALRDLFKVLSDAGEKVLGKPSKKMFKQLYTREGGGQT